MIAGLRQLAEPDATACQVAFCARLIQRQGGAYSYIAGKRVCE